MCARAWRARAWRARAWRARAWRACMPALVSGYVSECARAYVSAASAET